MRYRDYFWILFPVVLLTIAYFTGLLQSIGFKPTAEEIDRDDAKRVSTILLSRKEWTEFHLSPDAQSIRVLTNGALETTVMPKKKPVRPAHRLEIQHRVSAAGRRWRVDKPAHLRIANPCTATG